MTYLPTPEEFLAQPSTEEDDLEPVEPTSPLESIARSMEALVSLVQRLDAQAADAVALNEDLTGLQKSYQRLADEAAAKQALIDQVLEVCKPSTSKLASSIRAVLQPPAAAPAEEPADESAHEGQPCPLHGWTHQFKTCEQVTAEQSAAPAVPPQIPAHDADVWEWRSYAIRLGHDNVEVGRMNRSQIRTMLGIPHGEGAQA